MTANCTGDPDWGREDRGRWTERPLGAGAGLHPPRHQPQDDRHVHEGYIKVMCFLTNELFLVSWICIMKKWIWILVWSALYILIYWLFQSHLSFKRRGEFSEIKMFNLKSFNKINSTWTFFSTFLLWIWIFLWWPTKFCAIATFYQNLYICTILISIILFQSTENWYSGETGDREEIRNSQYRIKVKFCNKKL